MSADTVAKILADAMDDHSNGRLESARALYNQVLALDPANVDAIHLLGVLEFRLGNYRQGLSMVVQAHQTRPNTAIRTNIGSLLASLRRQIDEKLMEGKVREADPLLEILLQERFHYNICSEDRIKSLIRYIVFSTYGGDSQVNSHDYFALLSHYISHNKDTDLGKAIIKMANDIINMAKSDSSDFHYNGEAFLLWKLSNFPFEVVFDVGANQGAWSIEASKFLQGAKIHAFEPVPVTFSKLKENTADYSRVHVNPFGLLDADRTATVNLSVESEDNATASILQQSTGFTTVECRFTSGDAFRKTADIGHIDLLKVDTEGAEKFVLSGFTEALGQGRISVMQCEYNRWAIRSKFTLKDFYDLLTPLGYAIGKLRSRGVEFKTFNWNDDDFYGPNIVACHKSRPDIAAAIAAPGFTPVF